MSRHVVVSYAVGGMFVAVTAALTMLAVSILWSGGSLTRLPGGPFWNWTSLVGVEFALLVCAAAAFMVAEFSRRGEITRRRDGVLGAGTNEVRVDRLKYPTRLMWMVVPVVLWALVVPVPLAAARAAGGAWVPQYDGNSTLWLVLACNGFAAAGALGAMIASLVKAIGYDRALTRGWLSWTKKGKVAKPENGRGFWVVLSYNFRLELILGVVALGTVGCLPFTFEDPTSSCTPGGPCVMGLPGWVFASILTAVITGSLSMVIALNAWRSGKPLTAGESLVGGILTSQ